MDPLADPMLLELAELVGEMRSSESTVVLCTQRLKSRTGYRFVDALRALGHRVLPAPQLSAFASWASAPRAFGAAEELLLVTDWRAVPSCLDVLCEAPRTGGNELNLMGLVCLCEPREAAEATAATQCAGLPCRWHVFSSLAF